MRGGGKPEKGIKRSRYYEKYQNCHHIEKKREPVIKCLKHIKVFDQDYAIVFDMFTSIFSNMVLAIWVKFLMWLCKDISKIITIQ